LVTDVKLAISELTTYRWSLEADVLAAQAHHYSGVGLWLPKLADYGVEKAVELMQEHGLQPSSLCWAGGFTGSDGGTYRDALVDALDTVQLASQLRVPTLLVCSGGRNNHIRSHARGILVRVLRELSEAAQAVQVHLAIEPMHLGCRANHSFIHTIEEAMQIVAAVDHPHLGLALDLYHVGLDDRLLEWLPMIQSSLKLVQLADAKHAPLGEENRCMLGTGTVPLTDVLQTLQAIGYEGYCEVELMGPSMESLEYDEVLQQSKQFFDAALRAPDNSPGENPSAPLAPRPHLAPRSSSARQPN
jgi:sugar phosphate isomerase/epimerase